jgi:2',3'-cyclic-nucleotide 2'-phosphodiesterase (5'-nucleotidase family)
MSRFRTLAAWAPRLVLLVAIGPAAPPVLAQTPVFELQILHSSDNESAFIDPITLEPRLLHYATLAEGLKAIAPNGGRNTLHLTAGDHSLPGPLYLAARQVPRLGANGLADIAFFNAMGLAANGIGNHEFDGGIDDFALMLSQARYPFIAANLDFSKARVKAGTPAIRIGRDGGSIEENAGKVVRSAYATVSGEKIGLIGRAPADFFNVIASPDKTIPGIDFVGGRDPRNEQPLVSALDQVLEQVWLLEAQGIDKIILLDHAQDFTVDRLSASDMHGIDIVVSAGATGFLAKAEAQGPFNHLRPQDKATTAYPTERRDRDGHPVLVVNSDQLYGYIGHLIVGFDQDGHIARIDPRSGPIATTIEAITELEKVVGRSLAPSAEIKRTFDELAATPMVADLLKVVGRNAVALNGERLDVRTRETNLGRIAAESTLWYARRTVREKPADIALKNGGGLRGSIPAPQMTGFTTAQALAFDNKQTVTEITARGLLAAMENAVSRVPAADGRFPHLAGAYLEFDASRPGLSDQPTLDKASRVKTLKVARANGPVDVVVENFAIRGDPDRRFVLATNDFLMDGGDGYQSLKAAAAAFGKTTPEAGERRILIDYVTEALGGQVNLADPPPDPRVVQVGG